MSVSPPKRLAPSVLNSTLSKTKSQNHPGESLPSKASYGFRMGPLGGFKAFQDYPTNLHLLSSRKDGLTHLPKFLGFQNNGSMKAFKAEPKQAPIAHNLLSSARNEKRTYASIGSTNISQRRSYRGIHHSPNRPETSDLSVLNDSLEGIQSQDSFYGAMFGPTATQANQDEVVTSPISQRFPQKRQSSREPMKKRDVIIDKLPAFDMSPKLSSRRGERSLKVLGFGNQVSRESLMNVSTEPEKSPRRSLNRSISERLAQIKKNKELIQNLETPDLYIGRSLPQKLDTEHQKTNPDASSDYYSPSLPGNKETRKTPHSPLARATEKRLTLTKTPSSEGNKARRSHRRIGFGGPLTNAAFGDSHLIMKTEPSRRSGIGGRTGNLNMTNTLIHH